MDTVGQLIRRAMGPSVENVNYRGIRERGWGEHA